MRASNCCAIPRLGTMRASSTSMPVAHEACSEEFLPGLWIASYRDGARARDPANLPSRRPGP